MFFSAFSASSAVRLLYRCAGDFGEGVAGEEGGSVERVVAARLVFIPHEGAGEAERHLAAVDHLVEQGIVEGAGSAYAEYRACLAEAGYLRRTDWSFGPLPGDYVDGLPCHLQVGWTPTREERRLGWVGVDATGQLNLGQSDWSRQAQTVGLFGAVDLGRGLAVEASWSWTWAAVAASRGHGASLGVSWTLPLLAAR